MTERPKEFDEVRFRRALLGPSIILRVVEDGVVRDAVAADLPQVMRQLAGGCHYDAEALTAWLGAEDRT